MHQLQSRSKYFFRNFTNPQLEEPLRCSDSKEDAACVGNSAPGPFGKSDPHNSASAWVRPGVPSSTTPAPKPTAPGLPFLRLFPVSALGRCRDRGCQPHSPPQTWVSSWGHSREAFKEEEYTTEPLALPPGHGCPAPPDTAGRGAEAAGAPARPSLLRDSRAAFGAALGFPAPAPPLGLTAKGLGRAKPVGSFVCLFVF